MKHGPIALIDPKFPTFALVPRDAHFAKVKSNLQEVQARGGKIIALTQPGADLTVDHPWEIPAAWGPLSTFLMGASTRAARSVSARNTSRAGLAPDEKTWR